MFATIGKAIAKRGAIIIFINAKVFRRGNKFLQIFYSRLTLFTSLLLVELNETCLMYDLFAELK